MVNKKGSNITVATSKVEKLKQILHSSVCEAFVCVEREPDHAISIVQKHNFHAELLDFCHKILSC